MYHPEVWNKAEIPQKSTHVSVATASVQFLHSGKSYLEELVQKHGNNNLQPHRKIQDQGCTLKVQPQAAQPLP